MMQQYGSWAKAHFTYRQVLMNMLASLPRNILDLPVQETLVGSPNTISIIYKPGLPTGLELDKEFTSWKLTYADGVQSED